MSQILDSLSQFAHITNRDEQKESNSAWLPTSINKKEMSVQDALFISKCLKRFITPVALLFSNQSNTLKFLNSKTFHDF